MTELVLESDTEAIFNSAVSIVRNLPKNGPIQPSNEMKLKFYAYFKQATQGKNDTKKPVFYRVIENYKWEAWYKLGDMSKEDAMKYYIEELKKAMDSLPDENGEHFSAKYFEDVLGLKRFETKRNRRQQHEQQQRFNKLEQQQQQQSLMSSSNEISVDKAERRLTEIGLSSLPTFSHNKKLNNTEHYDYSNSLSASPNSDGYKTPTGSVIDNDIHKTNFDSNCNKLIYQDDLTNNSILSDQISLAILRLQNGMDEARTRLDQNSKETENIKSRLRRLEEFAFPNEKTYNCNEGTDTDIDTRNQHSRCQTRSIRSKLFILSLPGQLIAKGFSHKIFKQINWFNISWPFLVYILLHLYERRRRKSGQLV